MRILILNWRDIKHPLSGGAEISTHEHAKRWTKAGHEVIQFSSAVNGRKSKEIVDSIQIIRKGNHYTVHIYAFFHYMRHLRGKVDLVVDEFHFIPFFTPLYVKEKKLAFIHETAEEVWFKNQLFPINVLGFLLEPLFFKFYKNVLFMTVSESTKKDLIRFGINEHKIHIIPNGGVKAINSIFYREKIPTLLFLGRLAKDKGTEDAILAFYKIAKTWKSARLWIVGREEKKGYLTALKNKVKSLHLNKKVIFFNYVPEKRKFELLKKAWLLIHPSIKEGWGLTVIEAASCGTPTIAYNVSGLRDSIVDGKTGLLSNKNPNALADKILMLFQNPVLYNTLSKNALSWSKKFNWENSTKKSLNLINSLI